MCHLWHITKSFTGRIQSKFHTGWLVCASKKNVSPIYIYIAIIGYENSIRHRREEFVVYLTEIFGLRKFLNQKTYSSFVFWQGVKTLTLFFSPPLSWPKISIFCLFFYNPLNWWKIRKTFHLWNNKIFNQETFDRDKKFYCK